MNRKDKRQFKKPSENKRGAVFQVKEDAPLMEFLMAQMPGKSRSKVKFLLGNKQVLVDGKAISQFNHPLKQGQQIEISKVKAEAQKNLVS